MNFRRTIPHYPRSASIRLSGNKFHGTIPLVWRQLTTLRTTIAPRSILNSRKDLSYSGSIGLHLNDGIHGSIWNILLALPELGTWKWWRMRSTSLTTHRSDIHVFHWNWRRNYTFVHLEVEFLAWVGGDPCWVITYLSHWSCSGSLFLDSTSMAGELPTELGLLTQLGKSHTYFRNVCWSVDADELRIQVLNVSGPIPSEIGACENLGMFEYWYGIVDAGLQS